MSADALFNGAPDVPALAQHRGLHYGDGVFRTCLIYDSQIIDLEDHIKKAVNDAARLGLLLDDVALRAEAAALAAGQARGLLKILVVRAGGERGYRSATTASDRLLCRYPAPLLAHAAWEQGVRVERGPFRLALQPALAGVKHLNRLEQVLASRDWPAGVEERLLEDAEGRPVGGTRTNLFWVRRGAVRTPALERCGVAGVMRSRVLLAAAALGLDGAATDATWTDIDAADEVFLTNSVIGIWPVAALGTRRWDAPGPITRTLMAQLRHPRVCD